MTNFKAFLESLPRLDSVKQLKKLRKITKSTDIGEKIKDDTMSNAIDHVESFEEYIKNNKKK